MLAEGSNRASAVSMRDCTPPIHAWKSVSAIFIGLGGSSQRFEDLALEDFHLLLRRLELLLAEARELDPALVGRECLLERQLAAFHSPYNFFQFGERLLEGQL